MTTKILYLCDRRKCKLCTYPECKHTSDPLHAKNFYIEYDTLVEEGFDERDQRSLLQRLLQKLQICKAKRARRSLQ